MIKLHSLSKGRQKQLTPVMKAVPIQFLDLYLLYFNVVYACVTFPPALHLQTAVNNERMYRNGREGNKFKTRCLSVRQRDNSHAAPQLLTYVDLIRS